MATRPADAVAAGAPAALAGPGDGVLATKLHLPPCRRGFVQRPRLLTLLDEAAARDVTLVCAPAGSGKTALLADWARQRKPAVAWLSLDAADSDPARFWRHVLAGARSGSGRCCDAGPAAAGGDQPRHSTR